MKKVVLFWPYFPPQAGAAAARGAAFAKYLSKRYEVAVITPKGKVYGFFSAKPTVVVASYPGIYWALYGLLRAKLWGAEFYLDARDLSRGKKFLFDWLCRESRQIFVTTELQRLLLNKPNVLLVSNGVDLAELHYQNLKKGVDVVYAGNINDDRQPEALVMIANELGKRGWKFQFIGLDHSNKFETDFVKMTGVGFVEEVPPSEVFDKIQRAKIGLITMANKPEIDYQLPVKVYEYMAAGLPVAALVPRRETELRKFMEKYQSGMMSDEPAVLVKQIGELLNDEKRWLEISRRNLEIIKEFDRRKWIESIEF